MHDSIVQKANNLSIHALYELNGSFLTPDECAHINKVLVSQVVTLQRRTSHVPHVIPHSETGDIMYVYTGTEGTPTPTGRLVIGYMAKHHKSWRISDIIIKDKDGWVHETTRAS